MTKDEHLRGDPRLDAADRAILRRLTSDDLVDEFAEALDQDAAKDPLLGGRPHDDE